MKNLGWLFYKNYFDFRSLKTSMENEGKTEESFFLERNKNIFEESFVVSSLIKVVDETNIIKLKTTYPGLLSGSGVMHETGKLGELKLGFSFDYTTGLPYLAGSTVKGSLRQVFPNRLRYKASKEKNRNERIKLFDKADALEKYCCEYLFGNNITKKQLFQLEWLIFEGKRILNTDEVFTADGIHFHRLKENSIPIYESDIFHDAFIDAANSKNSIVGNDFITPHEKPLKNPIPIQFLKILPEVTLAFQFNLKKSIVDDTLTFTSQQKINIFKDILLLTGIGAKTNVGYGQLK